MGLVRARAAGRRGDLWPSALALALGGRGTRDARTGLDGWHGLGWRAIADPAAPAALRWALAAGGSGLALLAAGPIAAAWGRRAALWGRAREAGCLGCWRRPPGWWR
jgi:hypothetical protein